MASESERISEVTFDEESRTSLYIKPVKMHFVRKNQKVYWDMALEQDSVAVLLYHTEKKQIILVKQFRPAVFVQRVRCQSENTDVPLNKIDWPKYPVQIGEAFELCAGLLDKKNKSPVEHVREEIFEECGYNVKSESIKFLKKYLTGIGISGARQHLFYCEVDESMKANDGGGLKSEGEYIEKVFLDINEAKAFVEQEDLSSPPSLLYAVSWFLANGFCSS